MSGEGVAAVLALLAAALLALPARAEMAAPETGTPPEEGVPAPVLTEALYSRFVSRGLADYAFKVQSAQRQQFGGHIEKKD